MSEGDWGSRVKKSEPFVPWKPDACEHDGCAAPFPSFSKHGRAGPWLCAEHIKIAQPRRPAADLLASPGPPPDRLL